MKYSFRVTINTGYTEYSFNAETLKDAYKKLFDKLIENFIDSTFTKIGNNFYLISLDDSKGYMVRVEENFIDSTFTKIEWINI